MLRSIIYPPEQIDNLVSSSTQVEETEASKLNSILPEDQFATDKLIEFKENLTSTIGQYDDVPESLQGMITEVYDMSNHELSTALYNAGYKPSDLENFDFSVQSMSDVRNSVQSFQRLAAGGCDIILNAKRQITSPTEISLSDLDLEKAIEGFVIGVERDITSILKAAEENVESVIENVTKQAEELAGTISGTIDSLLEITPGDVEKYFEDAATEYIRNIESSLESLISGITLSVQELVNIADNCVVEQEQTTIARMGIVEKNAENLPTRIPSVSSERLKPTETAIKKLADDSKELVNERNKAIPKIETATVTKIIDERNVDAEITHKENLAKWQVTKATEQRTREIEMKNEYALKKDREAEANFKDLVAASKQRSFNPALAGREVVQREAVIQKAEDYINVTFFDESFFYPSVYAAKIAQQINTLNRSIRQPVALAIHEFLSLYYNKKWDITITSALRSIDRQRALYNKLKPLNKPVAYPGNSWHNYGLAVDIGLIYEGRYQQKESAYNGILAPIMRKHGFHNPFARDAIHFQPVVVRDSPRDIKDQLLVAGRVDNKAVSNLLA